jgi:peptide-methionine (S)-S-oxide reductase
MQKATFGGGCFWCTEAIFQRLKGVEKVTSGYSGGKGPAYYEMVSGGDTGYAESIQIEFDPEVISYRTILEVFFNLHDPTTLNRQGADVGTEYRSVIFYHDESQKNIAEEVMKEIESSGKYKEPIVTEVVPFETFTPAEGYHQNYYNNNKEAAYCRIVIDPKITKLYKNFGNITKNAE